AVAARDDGIGDLGVERAEIAIGHGGGFLHIAQRLHEVRLLAHRNAGDVKVLFAADGLDAVIDVVADLACSEKVLLDPAHGTLLACCLRGGALPAVAYWLSALMTKFFVLVSPGSRVGWCR